MGSCRRKPSSNGLVRTEGQVLRMHDQLDLTKRACFHLCILIKMDGRKLLPLDYVTIFGIFRLVHCQVTQCYIGVLDAYANPNTLTMFDMSEVMTYKLIDCDKAHYPKEIIQVNERRYEFGDPNGSPDGWVCAKIPHDGSIKKDCVPKREAPGWYVHLLENRDFQGCNGAVCFCDDRNGCNSDTRISATGSLILVLSFIHVFL